VSDRVVWVHGIGDHKAGYSDPWRVSFDRHLHFPVDSYVEVLWETVFDGNGATRGGPSALPTLTRQEQAAEEQVREELRALILARSSAIEQAGAPATRGGDGEVIEWSAGAETRGIDTWILQADEYLGDFVKYLVSRPLRSAVKERFKERVRPLADAGSRIGVVSHSWGTVVSYDSLLDLSAEIPSLRIAMLATLGSPLWAVRRFLDDKTGRKPPNVGTWVNVHARLDVVGSWLAPAFRVDRDFEVPNFGQEPHGSYFWSDNDTVQKDLVARYLLEVPA
jgi:hypothetical protein